MGKTKKRVKRYRTGERAVLPVRAWSEEGLLQIEVIIGFHVTITPFVGVRIPEGDFPRLADRLARTLGSSSWANKKDVFRLTARVVEREMSGGLTPARGKVSG